MQRNTTWFLTQNIPSYFHGQFRIAHLDPATSLPPLCTTSNVPHPARYPTCERAPRNRCSWSLTLGSPYGRRWLKENRPRVKVQVQMQVQVLIYYFLLCARPRTRVQISLQVGERLVRLGLIRIWRVVTRSAGSTSKVGWGVLHVPKLHPIIISEFQKVLLFSFYLKRP